MYCSCLIWQEQFCWKYYKRTIKLHDQCHLSTWKRQVHSISPHWILWTKDKEWWQPSGASRPSDKGGPPVIQTFGPHFGLKIRGGGLGFSPGSATATLSPARLFFLENWRSDLTSGLPFSTGKTMGTRLGMMGVLNIIFLCLFPEPGSNWSTEKPRNHDYLKIGFI